MPILLTPGGLEKEGLLRLQPPCPYTPEVQMVLPSPISKPVRLMVVGEAPGRIEEERGEFFVGRAGQLLKEVLKDEGVIEETYFTNASFWRPPKTGSSAAGDERPGLAVLRSQFPRLLFEILSVAPSAVLAVGASAAQAFGVSEFHRGEVVFVRAGGTDYPVFVTWHPAFIFRSPEMYPDLVRDIQRAIALEVPREADASYVRPTEPVSFIGRHIFVDIETSNTSTSSAVACVSVRDQIRSYLFTSSDLPLLKESLSLYTGRVIGHNSSTFDEGILRRHGIDVTFHQDTLLLHLALDGRKNTHSLKTLSPSLGNRQLLNHTVIPKEGAENVWEDTNPEMLYRYCVADVVGTKDLYSALVHFSDSQERRLYVFLKRAARALSDGMQRGILIDREALAAALVEQEYRVVQLHDIFPFDPDSPKQTVEALRAAGHDVISSSEAVLQRLPGDLPRQILQYREDAKISRTFLKPLLEQWIDEERVVHPRFLLYGTSTGRLSSQNPNAQNIPEHLRHFFIARPGHQLIAWDLRSAEVRCIAYYSQDESLIQMLREGLDPHQAVADAAGLTRQQGKSLVFGSVYGAGVRKLRDSLGVDEGVVRRGLDVVGQLFPRLPEWKRNVIGFVGRHGYVETPFHRRISFPYQDSLTEQRVKRQAINAMPQSLGSDISLVGLIRAYERVHLVPLITVHDSVVVECPEEILDQKVSELKRYLIDLFPNPYVDFPVDMKAGPNWGSLHVI